MTDRMTPLEELEWIDECCRQAERDERKTMFDPSCHPKRPDGREEGVTSPNGDRMADIMADTPPVGDEFGLASSFDVFLDDSL